MEIYELIHGLRYAVTKLSDYFPDEIKKIPEIHSMLQLHYNFKSMHFVRLLYQDPEYELSSKDYEFSQLSMKGRSQAGYQNALRAIEQSPWLTDANEKYGIAIHEFTQDTI